MKLFIGYIKNSLTILLCGIFLLGEIWLQAAKAPLSQEQLDDQSELIISGQIVVVGSEVKKSTVVRGLGVFRDRIYTIKVKVRVAHKMCPDRALLNDLQIVEAWSPVTRIPPAPGLQGHESIPKKGAEVKMYLKWNKTKALWEPLLPNGIEIIKKAKKLK